MVNYLYKHIIYHDTSRIAGANVTQEALDTADFETHKSDTLEIQELVIFDNTFVIDKSYSDFKALLTDGIDWSDVKFVTKKKTYELYIMTTSEL